MSTFANLTNMPIRFGTITLLCWIGASLSAVVGIGRGSRHSEPGSIFQLATSTLTAAGMTSAVAMVAVLVLA